MAILKMKKLRLVAVRSQKEALLRELIRYGCVEFSELADAEESALKRESADIATLKAQHSELTRAVSLLDEYAPKKSGLLTAKPELDEAELLDDTGLTGALRVARAIEDYDARIKRISGEESRERSTVEALKPWLPLEMPLGTESTERCSVLLGTIPARTKLERVAEAMEQADSESDVYEISADKTSRYIVALCMKERLGDMQDCLRQFDFTAASFGAMEGSASVCTLAANRRLKELGEEKESCKKSIVSEASRRDELKLAADRVCVKIQLAEAEDMLCGTESTVVMEGWIPEEREAELEQVFARFGCAWETEEPKEEEYPEVPVELKNNKFTDALNIVTNMYSLPAYGSVDPNPLMAPFFIIFYGLMLADMGYGLIMIAAALTAMAKIKPREGSLSFCRLLLYGGISTFIMGICTGGFFGDAPYQLVHMINPESTWEGLPYLFSPVNNSTVVLYGAMALGVIHLNTGMAVSFVQKVKRGQLADGMFSEFPLWVMLLGIVMMGLSALGVTDALYGVGKVVLIAGSALLLFGSARGAKGFHIFTAALNCVYSTLTGWFGDILSYSRIMALMLAGGVVAQVFNTIAAMPANSSGVNALTIAAFILIFLIGHALNFSLNLLGCFVHDLRLQCLEFFGKFYEDGGKPFKPLRFKSDYVRVRED